MKTVSLELSQQLEQAGYPQQGDFWWSDIDEGTDESWLLRFRKEDMGYPQIASPSADEILEQLPRRIRIRNVCYWLQVETQDDEIGWSCQYKNTQICLHFEEEEIIADAAAKCWLYLKKEGII